MAIRIIDTAKWYRDFEHALSGSRARLKLIVPEGTDITQVARDIDNANNAYRRDVYHRGYRLSFEGSELPFTTGSDHFTPFFTWPQDTTGYTESDYRQTDATDMEQVYLDTLIAQRSIQTPFLTPTELNVGDRVVVWIKDHFYENQTAIVLSHRERTNEYLIEIQSKRPFKRGYSTNPGAKGQMYVKLEDVKLCRRKS